MKKSTILFGVVAIVAMMMTSCQMEKPSFQEADLLGLWKDASRKRSCVLPRRLILQANTSMVVSGTKTKVHLSPTSSHTAMVGLSISWSKAI